MTITEDAMFTVRTDAGELTLTPTALASGRYPGVVVETIPVRSQPKTSADRRWHVR